MSDLESIIAVSEPFEEEFEANALGSIEAEEVKKNKKRKKKKTSVVEGTLSFNFNIAVALVEDNSNVVENEFTEAVGEIEGRNSILCLSVRRYVSLKVD